MKRRCDRALFLFPLSFLVGCGGDMVPGGLGHKTDDSTTTIVVGPYVQAPGDGTMTILWHTDLESTSRVEYGSGPNDGHQLRGIVYKQQPSIDDDVYAGVLPETFKHKVVVTGLEPGQIVHYRILSAPQPTRDATFRVLPVGDDPFTFVIFGDTRTDDEDHAMVIGTIMKEAGDAVFAVHTGDMVSAGGVESQWEDFFSVEAPLVRQIPLLGVMGNHELIGGRTLVEDYFEPPPSSTSRSALHYSFDVGPVHIAVLDIYEMDFDPHRDWLEQDLADSTASFKIVVLHPPLFTCSKHPPDADTRAWLVPVCEQAGVQVVFSGHNHGYERFFGSGIQFVVTAGGGAPLYDVSAGMDHDNAGAQRVAAASAFHFVRGRYDHDVITFDVVGAPDGNEMDCFVIDPARPGQDLPCHKPRLR